MLEGIDDLKGGPVSGAGWLEPETFAKRVQEEKVWMQSGKEWRMKGKRGGLSTCQSKDMRRVGDTYQKGSICGRAVSAERQRRDSQSTDSVCSRLHEPFVCWSVVVVVGGGEDGGLERG